MPNRYFGFSCSPFENNLDQRFLFLSKCHEEVIEALLYFIEERKGFALLCGDVGMGKTMIVHHLLGKLPGYVLPILVPYPDVEYIELLRFIARVLNISTEGKGVLELTTDVKAALIEADLKGEQVVLIIDEAHLLSISSLENIRLLSNMEISEKKLLQILLIGQNELGLKLGRSEMRQLRQRINISRVLSPMSPSETVEYVSHRLKIAGACFDHRLATTQSCFDGCFEPECKKLLYAMTGGVPRTINQLCDNALFICKTEQLDFRVTRRILKKAYDALNSDLIQAPGAHPTGAFFHGFSYAKEFRLAFAAAALALVLTLAVLGFKYNVGERLKGLAFGPDARKEKNEVVEKRQLRAFEAAISGKPAAQAGDNGIPERPQGEVKITHESAAENDTALPIEEKAEPGLAVPEKTQADYQTPDKIQGGPSEQGVKQAAGAEKGNQDNALYYTGTEVKTSGPSDFFIVIVQKGESLIEIAKRLFPKDPEFGKRLILSANPEIVDQNRILAGQTLRVPRKSGEAGSDPGPGSHPR